MDWLQSGSRGDAVKELQEKLLAKGTNPGTADDIFGSKTAEAVRRYQEQNGLQVDGIAGPETFKSLGMMEDGKAKETATRRPQEPSAEETAGAKVKAAKAKLDARAEEEEEEEADAKAAATNASSVDALRKAEQTADKAAAGKTAAEAETRIGSGLDAVKEAAAKSAKKEAPKGFKAKLEAMREAVRARKSRDR